MMTDIGSYTNNQFPFDDDETEDESDGFGIGTFSLVTTPNDFNITTIINFMDKGVFIIPKFQRNFVWDIKKSSKLIESLIIGLPIPQIFLYEKERNEFYVIDGQQRLLTLYFFYKGRFPKSSEARNIIKETSSSTSDLFIPQEIISDDNLFTNFPLQLNSKKEPVSNTLHNKNFSTLGKTLKTDLELSTIRNMVIKPKYPEEDSEHLAMFEIFNRLNSGGMNLSSQEIRLSLYSCAFMSNLTELNKNAVWRNFLGKKSPDLRLKDSEIILRLFSMLDAGIVLEDAGAINYSNSMIGFLNSFANNSRNFDNKVITKYSELWDAFLQAIEKLEPYQFSNSKQSNKTLKLSIPVLESVFTAFGIAWMKGKRIKSINSDFLTDLKKNTDLLTYCIGKTNSRNSIEGRIKIASEFFGDYYD